MEQKNLLLVNFRGDLKVLDESLAGREEPCIYFGSFLSEALKENHRRLILSETFLEPKDFKEIDEFMWQLSRNWYKDIAPLGEFVEFDFQLFLFKKVKNLIILSKIVSRHHPVKTMGSSVPRN